MGRRQVLASFDSSVHISEEASNAATAVPWAIVGAIAISGILGWGMWSFRKVKRVSSTHSMFL